MIINDSTLALVKHFEGLRLESYKCPAGIWTIGYGHTKNVHAGSHISAAMAEQLLSDDLQQCADYVYELVTVQLTPDQLGALSSFVFNLGPGALRISTLLKRLNSGSYGAVPEELNKWNKCKVNGELRPLLGLTLRRKAEGLLFESKHDELTELMKG